MTNPLSGLDLAGIETPVFIVNESLLEQNARLLASVRERTGCVVLAALKGYAMYSTFPVLAKYLDGVCASGIHEARLGREEFGKQVHVYNPAYTDADIAYLNTVADHIIFNSPGQWERYGNQVADGVSCGLRINPEYSEVNPPIYNPCSPFSRLGIPLAQLADMDLDGVSGLHFHTHCEQNADALERSLHHIEKKFGDFFARMQWVNFGGGHHITRPDYDVELLCRLVTDFKRKYDVQVILEPGEAVALHTGVLVASVLDIVENGMPIAILDTSAAAHMPDVLEMPYRPEIVGAGKPAEKKFTYRLGGQTCLAGDVIGDYSFDEPLRIGDKLVFLDMAHYSMVKTNTFNGMPLPAIGIIKGDGRIDIVKRFGYGDFKGRLS